MRKTCEDGTGAAGTGRSEVVVVVAVGVSVVVVVVVVNIDDFSVLADVGSIVVLDKYFLDDKTVVTDFVKNFLVDPGTFPPLSKIGIFFDYFFGFS